MVMDVARRLGESYSIVPAIREPACALSKLASDPRVNFPGGLGAPLVVIFKDVFVS